MEIMKICILQCELPVIPLPAVHRITTLFYEREALLWPLDFVFVFGSSSSSSMFVTSTAEGTGSSSMLVMEQGAGSDAMAVSCGGRNQIIRKERNDQFTNRSWQLLKYSQ